MIEVPREIHMVLLKPLSARFARGGMRRRLARIRRTDAVIRRVARQRRSRALERTADTTRPSRATRHSSISLQRALLQPFTAVLVRRLIRPLRVVFGGRASASFLRALARGDAAERRARADADVANAAAGEAAHGALGRWLGPR